MSAPTLIAWDTNNANVLIPDAGHIANGWAPLEKPTCNNHNWMFQNIFNWISYIAGPTGVWPLVTNISGAGPFTITHNFGRTVQVICTDAINGLGNVIGYDNLNYASLNQIVVSFAGSQTGSIIIF